MASDRVIRVLHRVPSAAVAASVFTALGFVTTVVVAWGLAVVRPEFAPIASGSLAPKSVYVSIYAPEQKWNGSIRYFLGQTSFNGGMRPHFRAEWLKQTERTGFLKGPGDLLIKSVSPERVPRVLLDAILRHAEIFERRVAKEFEPRLDPIKGVPGVTQDLIERASRPEPLRGVVTIEQWGFPLRAFQSMSYQYEPPGQVFGFPPEMTAGTLAVPTWLIPWPSGDPRLPIQPLWLGLFLNTLIGAATWFLLWRARGWFGRGKILRRVRAGLCPACSYDLAADYREGCPECGFRRDRA